jgi:ppGpp synthetase/RelA/SpoT-type nucleotidyltranferase
MNLREFHLTDFPEYLNLAKQVVVSPSGSDKSVSIKMHLHFDFANRATFFSIYVPNTQLSLPTLVATVISRIDNLVKDLAGAVEVTQGDAEGNVVNSAELVFNRVIYVYTEEPLTMADHELVRQTDQRNSIVFRSQEYLNRRRELESLIDAFLIQYEKEQPAYAAAATFVQLTLEKALSEAKILAWVTSRAKNPKRLKDKVWKRALPVETGKPYRTVADIFADLVDLAGVRIALYFPGQRSNVGETITQLLTQSETPLTYTGGKTPPSYGRRFSGYWATHYRVKLSPEQQPDELKLSHDILVEIQVASIAMHAWSEVEHDLQYKQLQGPIWEDEKRLLDQLNGLMLSAEMILELLQEAGERRKQRIKEIQEEGERRSAQRKQQPPDSE